MFPHTPSRRKPFRQRTSARLCATALILTATAAAQGPAPSEADATTLHVYANMLQIPVLILGPNQQPVPPIAPAKFTVQFDDDVPFRPRLVRMEGEDPITLSILIDGSHRNGLIPGLVDALASLAPGSLHSNDHFAMYLTDGCALRRVGEPLPVQTTLIRIRAELALEHKPYDPREAAGPCRSPSTLWKSMAMIANEMYGLPGRRVLLAITDGVDTGKEFSVDQVHRSLADAGVAVFSVAQSGHVPPGPEVVNTSTSPMSVGGRGGRGMPSAPPSVMHGPSDLATVTESSGGLVLETSPRDLKSTLSHFVGLVRGRYIVEFARPQVWKQEGLSHLMNIAVGQPRYLIRSAGTSMPIADPSQPDPTVEHGVSDPNSIDRASTFEEPAASSMPGPAVSETPAP